MVVAFCFLAGVGVSSESLARLLLLLEFSVSVSLLLSLLLLDSKTAEKENHQIVRKAICRT